MAFCIECGTQLPNEANFCPVCGTKRATATNDSAVTQKTTTPDISTQNITEPIKPVAPVIIQKDRRKLSKTAIIAIIAAGAVLLCAIVGVIIWAVVDAHYTKQYEETTKSLYSEYDENDYDIYDDSDSLEVDIDKYDLSDTTDRILAMNEYAGNIVENIANDKDYLDSGLYESCAVLTDANADDDYELYAVYYKDENGVPTAHCEVWSLEIGNEKLLLEDTLYKEVGGDSGSLSLHANAGIIYVGVTKRTPQDGRENNQYTFTLLNDMGKSSVESHILIENGGYTIDNESVSKSAFDQEMEKYYTLFSMPENSDNSPLVMTFDEFITIYG